MKPKQRPTSPAGDPPAGDDASFDDLDFEIVEASHEVGREHNGSSLLDALDAIWGPVDRQRVHAATRQAKLRLNGETAGPSVTLRSGDLIELLLPADQLQRRASERTPILFQNDELLVAAKPAGLPFDAGRARSGSSAVERLASKLPKERRPHAVHRLDKETSGVVVLALGRQAERDLQAALQASEAWIEYLAVIRWPPPEDEGVIDVPLLHGRRSDQRLSPDPDHGRPACTHWTITERLGDFAVLNVRPEGGRSRQVRAHLAALGHPVVGDFTHGEDSRVMLSQLKVGYKAKRGRPERPLLERPALHAARFVDPRNDRVVEAPLPRDLEVLLAQLRRLAPT
ncbi:MAG: pseudouridine synthase [Planctomycetota bacterium]|nr:MAG: pseudouridine synthase [Planctomycetota bacterium]